MKFDQYEEPRPEQVELARAVKMLIEAFYDEEGNLKDVADKEARQSLINLVKAIPQRIPANLREEDVRLLNDTIKQCRETRSVVKSWFWWVIGTMVLASSAISLCAVILLK